MIRYSAGLILLFSAYVSVAAFAKPATLRPIILDTKPHLEGAFTQGLIINNGEITETSGLYGKSYVVRYDAETNRVAQKMTLPRSYFAEGITQVGNNLYLLTWKEGKLFVLRTYSFEFVNTLNYTGEGWGITHDGSHFITSDGSSSLAFRDSETFEVQHTIQVHEGARTWDQLNELEFAQGLIWANVFHDSHILAINPSTGEVVGKADLSDLVAENSRASDKAVLNGIAYDEDSNAFWVTGKLWPKRYLLHFIWHRPLPTSSSAQSAPNPLVPAVPPPARNDSTHPLLEPLPHKL